MSQSKLKKLPRSFYDRPTLEVGEELLGKFIVYTGGLGLVSARIVEVEAYIGEDDPACHAAPGPTKRNQPLYGRPGMAYIYFIYGMYYCLNVVTERKGFPAAILMRAAEPEDGLAIIRKNGRDSQPGRLLSGPGKLCRGFGLTLAQNGVDLIGSVLYLEDRGVAPGKIERSPRIGIRKGLDRNWRFYDAESPAVSGRPARAIAEGAAGRSERNLFRGAREKVASE